MSRSQMAYALAHPIADPPEAFFTPSHWWRIGDMSACLTVNIGLE